MSAASRAREEQQRRKLEQEKYSDIPEPDQPPTPLDPELERLMSWYVQNRKQIAADHDCEKVAVSDEGGPILIGRKWRRTLLSPATTFRYPRKGE
jgi:hypothetical protein